MPEGNDVDLERCVATSIKQDSGNQQSSDSNAGRYCVIAIHYFDGRAVLINITIKEDVDGDLAFSSAKKEISKVVTKGWLQKAVGKLFMGLVVGTAQIKQIMHCRPQTPSPGHQAPPKPPCQVYLQDFTLDPLLTEALHNADTLLPSAAYPFNVDTPGSPPADNDTALDHEPAPCSNDVDDKVTGSCIEHDGPKVIVVRRVIDRAKVAWMLILLLFFSPVLGIGAGICSRNAKVGFAVSASVFALASFVQGLVIWIQG